MIVLRFSADRRREKLHAEIRRGVLNIATDGNAIGQVNSMPCRQFPGLCGGGCRYSNGDTLAQTAGRARAQGDFPPRSINGRVQQCLVDYAHLHMAFAGSACEPAAEDDKVATSVTKTPPKG